MFAVLLFSCCLRRLYSCGLFTWCGIGRLGWWVGCLLFVAVRLECSFEVLLVLDLGLLL